MSSFLTDKSMVMESRFGGWALLRQRPFAEPGIEPNYPPDRSLSIAYLELDLAVDPVAKTLLGVATVQGNRPVGAVGPIRLHLDELTVDSVEAGGPVQWRHADGILSVDAPAGPFTIVVRYHGSPRKGLYFVGPTAAEPHRTPEAWSQCQDEDGHFIFPCFDHPSVKHPFTIHVTAPAGYGVLSNGRLVEQHTIAPSGSTRWTWEQREPMPAYLFTLVVMKMDVHADEWDGIPVRYVVPTGAEEAMVRRVFGKTPGMVAFLSGLFGRYPWPRYDQVVVHDFIFGGMENIAATTLIDIVLTDERAALDYDANDLIVHELGHQWFGDLVTCQDWSQGWLNEGWATYIEYLWFAHDLGQDEADWHLWEQMGNYLGEDGGRYRRAIVSYLFRSPIDMFDRHLYEKGSLVNHTLRHLLGDSVFFPAVRHYLEKHRYGTVHTRDYQRALEEVSGRNLDRFFAEFVYGAGHPTLEVGISHADGLLTIHVKQTQAGENVASIFHVPLQVRYGTQTVRLNLDARERSYVLPCPEAPSFVAVDPEFQLLAEVTLKAPRSMLIAALKQDRSIVGRIRAARALATDGSPQAITALEDGLKGDPFWGTRSEIADLLAVRGGEASARALLAALSDPHPKARRSIVAALGRIRRPEVNLALKALPTDASLQVEGEVLRSLGRLRDPQTLELAAPLLAQDSWMEVSRCRAIEALGLSRNPEVLPVLLHWTGLDKPTRARAAAATALARLGDEVETARKPALERLIEMAEDAEYRVQVASINALGVLKEAGGIGVLDRVHASSGDGRCRRLAYEAMANIRDGRTTEQGLSILKKELEDLKAESQKLRDGLSKVEQRGG